MLERSRRATIRTLLACGCLCVSRFLRFALLPRKCAERVPALTVLGQFRHRFAVTSKGVRAFGRALICGQCSGCILGAHNSGTPRRIQELCGQLSRPRNLRGPRFQQPFGYHTIDPQGRKRNVWVHASAGEEEDVQRLPTPNLDAIAHDITPPTTPGA